MTDNVITIEMDEATQAFYKGVAVGREILERVKDEDNWEVKMGNFFFFAGRASAAIPDEHLERFAQGLSTGAPSEPEYVIQNEVTDQFWNGEESEWIGPDIDVENGPWPSTVNHSDRADYRMPEDGCWVRHDHAKHG